MNILIALVLATLSPDSHHEKKTISRCPAAKSEILYELFYVFEEKRTEYVTFLPEGVGVTIQAESPQFDSPAKPYTDPPFYKIKVEKDGRILYVNQKYIK